MKLGILWWEPGEVECLGIADVCRQRGHEVVLFGLEEIGCKDTHMGTVPTIAGTEAGTFDAVLSRAHVGAENWRDAVERLTLLSGTPGTLMLDPVSAHVGTVSKFAMLHRLTRSGIRVPPTRSVRTVADIEEAVDRWGRIVLKPSVGFRGIDVERFADGFGLGERAKASALLDRYDTLICQPYYPHEGDHRVLVIGEEPSVCTRFHTSGDAWKPFPGDGLPPDADWDVRIEVCDPSREMADIGIRATKAMGLSYAGVDIVETEDGPVVMEVNVVPGWGALPPDVQRIPNLAVADLIERRARELRPL